MKLERFKLERWLPELSVEINLAGALCVPLKYRDLIEGLDLDRDVTYGDTMGSPKLREGLVALFPGTGIHPDQVLITNGTAEANFLLLTSLLEEGDEFVLVVPSYLQSAGLARALGARVRLVSLHEGEGWKLHLDGLEAAVSPRTKVIMVTNPNNPTSSRLDAATLAAICNLAGRVGAYVVADEALKGLEADEVVAPSPAELYERGVSTGSLSKVGLSGIRIGWIVGPRDVVANCWAHKDYTTLAHGGFSETLAEVALQPENIARLRARARGFIREHRAILMEWIGRKGRTLSCVAPVAGATAFPEYQGDLDSVTFCERVRREVSVGLSPGDFFGGPKHFRIRFGLPRPVLVEGLSRLDRVLAEL